MTERLDWEIRKTASWVAQLRDDPEVILVARTKPALIRKINKLEKLMVIDQGEVSLKDIHSEL